MEVTRGIRAAKNIDEDVFFEKVLSLLKKIGLELWDNRKNLVSIAKLCQFDSHILIESSILQALLLDCIVIIG